MKDVEENEEEGENSEENEDCEENGVGKLFVKCDGIMVVIVLVR